MGFSRTPSSRLFVLTFCTMLIPNPLCSLGISMIGHFGGEEGIRTLVPGFPDHPISSRRRYDHFGTSPEGQE